METIQSSGGLKKKGGKLEQHVSVALLLEMWIVLHSLLWLITLPGLLWLDPMELLMTCPHFLKYLDFIPFIFFRNLVFLKDIPFLISQKLQDKKY